MGELRLNAIRLNTVSLKAMPINHIGFKKKASSSASGDVDENGYIIFADPEVARICAENWGDGIGITKEQAAAVTSIGTVFKGNADITSFEELKYFTGLSAVGNSAFYGCSNIQRMKFPSNITTVGEFAFYNCTSLAIDVLLEKLETLGKGAFYNSGIAKISSLGKIKTIYGGSGSAQTFYNCVNLTQVNFPETLEALGELSFNNCTSLEIEDLALPNLTTFGRRAFFGVKIKKVSNLGKITALPNQTNSFGNYDVLEEAIIPEGVTQIPSNCFSNYTNLKQVSIPSTCITLADSAFYNCTALTNLYGLENIKTIGVRSFCHCHSLISLELVNLESMTYESIRSCHLLEFVNLGNVTTIISTYDRHAMAELPKLKEIRLSDNIKEIQAHSFEGLQALETINLPQSIESIGARAFSNCPITNVIDLPNLNTIGSGVFRKSGITKILDLGTITEILGGWDIWYHSFGGCVNLSIAILPPTLTNIGQRAFVGDENLNVVISKASTPPTLDSIAFASTPIASGTGSIYVPDGPTTDADGNTITIVEAYKAATNWNTYAARIFPISQLAIDNPELYAEIEEYL